MAEVINTKDKESAQPLQSIECPICLSIFAKPKTLPCSHSYCTPCLERLLKGQTDQQKITCPVCKKVAAVPDGCVADLEVDEALRSQLAAAVNANLVCTICTGSQNGQRPQANNYCLDCDRYMCSSCFQRHLDWELFATHVIIPVQDIISGQTILRNRPKCLKHPTECEECFCTNCGRYTCFRCGVREHAQKNHRIVEASEHEGQQKKTIKQLKSRADALKATLSTYLVTVKEQKYRIEDMLQFLNDDIDSAYQEAINQLAERKKTLKEEAKERIKKHESNLQLVENTVQQRIDQVDAISSLVGNGVRMPLDKTAISAHDKLAENLKWVLKEGSQDLDILVSDSKAINLSFSKDSSISDGLEIGGLVEVKSKWVLKLDIAIPGEDGINDLTATADGRLAVGCNPGGIHLFSTDGKYETKLNSLKISRVDYLSDGRCVIRDPKNDLSLYTSDFEKLQVRFSTPHWTEGGYGGLTVDINDRIYASQSKQDIIQVFGSTGGMAIKEISCKGEKSWQMAAMKSRKMIVIQRTDRESVGIIDDSGSLCYSIKSKHTEEQACPALLPDDTVLIAWIRYKSGLLNIVQYTYKLEQIRKLVTDFKIQIPTRHSYFLEVFKTGEIAFSSKNHLYIFKET